MNRTIAAKLLRLFLACCVVWAVFAAVLSGLGRVTAATATATLLPFLAAAVSVVAIAVTLPWINRVVARVARRPTTTPYSALAKAAARIGAGSLEQALPGLARIIAEGTGAAHAVVWLAVEEKLVSAASYPADETPTSTTMANLATLLAQPGVDHVVPVLDGSALRAALSIGKPGMPVTPADQRLMHDVANGAGLLLRGVQLNAELTERVHRADELAGELRASRQRLRRARDVERRRLVTELTQVTTDRLAALRADIAEAQRCLSANSGCAGRVSHVLYQARTGLDDLLERFRIIARGVYPAVLRDQGPFGALDELATDLRRTVRVSGGLPRRLAWEVESGIYYLAASAMQQLAGQPADEPLSVHLGHTPGQLVVRIEDPTPPQPADEVLAALADDVDRLAALGGTVELTEYGAGGARLRAWLPDQLEPPVEDIPLPRPAPIPVTRTPP